MKMRRKILIGLSTILILIACFVTWIVGTEKYYIYVFEKTDVKIPQTELEKLWGKSGNVMTNKDGKVIFYYTTLNKFVFGIDKFGKVEFKWRENF